MKPQVVTANALVEGDVVYLDHMGRWVRRLEDAHVFTVEEDAKAALETAQRRTGEVVDVYLIVVALDAGIPGPTHFREAFRRRGPSNRFLGKQAEQQERPHVSAL
ncbi:DUF2849 domain-containing protein [Aquicoccus sp. G2-2]|uniref:DUF2849 domain-containing protein n=1 Tax=Aquicoccus sp. G2-2 TaxID=3092120 RepID=UPI002AE051DB|nr:DUF2849 domain-containing protein [Aquicoccus sp. G2-2]MEA1115270.1 DUF2849 domain-containing protein [Aquicoccus sp. G2-2]